MKISNNVHVATILIHKLQSHFKDASIWQKLIEAFYERQLTKQNLQYKLLHFIIILKLWAAYCLYKKICNILKIYSIAF